MSCVRVSLRGDLLNRYEAYAKLTDQTVTQAAKEALEDWMDTCGAGRIEVLTGIPVEEVNPTPSNIVVMPTQEDSGLMPLCGVGHC
jgi:hypothetical protein